MNDIRVPDELWANSMIPLGTLERWRVAQGEPVIEGQAVAEIRVEEALHELMAPCTGRIDAFAKPNDLVGPGVVIGRIEKGPAVH